jgi:hypothetical protein
MNTCVECARPVTNEVELRIKGLFWRELGLCKEHFDDAMAGADYWKREFGALIDCGVSNTEANRLLIARIDAGETPWRHTS